jgi:hypothetical protein
VGENLREGEIGKLRARDAFEPCLILDDNSRTLYLQEPFLFEIGEQPRHRFSGSPDHLGDFFLREREGQPHLTLSFVMLCGEIEQEASQFLTCGMRQPNRSHFRDRGVIGFTKLLRYAQRSLAVFAQKEQEICPRDEIRLRRFDYIGRELIRSPRDGRGQSQDLSLFRNPKNETSPIGRRA